MSTCPDYSNFLFKQKLKNSQNSELGRKSVFFLKKVTLKERLMNAEKRQSKARAIAEHIEVSDGESLATDDFNENLKEFYLRPELKD